jgi:hypothetical protein
MRQSHHDGTMSARTRPAEVETDGSYGDEQTTHGLSRLLTRTYRSIRVAFFQLAMS